MQARSCISELYLETSVFTSSKMSLEAQESVTPSEDWASDEEGDDYDNYYGEEDTDVHLVASDEDGGPQDASFQCDPEHYQFLCLSSEETWNFLDSQARDASKAIKLDIPSSRILLHHLHWDTKQLVQRFSANKENLLSSARLISAEMNQAVTLVSECPVCLSPLEGACSIRKLPCGHMFCLNCCLSHILSRIAVGMSTAIGCLQCSRLMDLETVQSFLQQSTQDFSRYLRLVLTDYVVCHPLLRWCPGPNCTTVFQVKESQAKKVTCSNCSHSCCFSCGEAYHCPTDCDSIREWLVKCRDDSETSNYIIANTKDCPNCHTSIEKDGGCNHMCCSQCHADFCWMCLQPWKTHNGYYNCSKYQEDGQEVNAARQALEKYLFYYHRWANHNRSLSLEEETKRKIMVRTEEKVSKGEGTWIDWQYLLDAVGLLKRCRYTLKYTYPYAYTLSGDKKPLFEYQQAQLEVAIENLSWKIERAETTDVAELRQQMSTTEVLRLTLLRDLM